MSDPLFSRVGGVRGPSGGTIDDVVTKLQLQIAAIDEAQRLLLELLRYPDVANGATAASILTSINGRLAIPDGQSVAQQLNDIEAVLGAGPYNSTETGNIRALLYALVQCCQKRGIDPDFGEGTITEGTGSITVEGRRYGVINANTDLTLDETHTKATPGGYWTFWSVYVQTDSPTANVQVWNSPGSDTSIPSNSWVSLQSYGNNQLSFWVNSQYGIKVYLKYHSTAITEYIWYPSDMRQSTANGVTVYVPNLTKYPELTPSSVGGYTDIHGTFTGWWCECTRPSTVHVWYGDGVNPNNHVIYSAPFQFQGVVHLITPYALASDFTVRLSATQGTPL